MSHVASVEVKVTDLDALKAACDRLGLEFKEGKRTHRWYGVWLDDWRSARAASTKGRDPKTFGTCIHAIGIKGDSTGYEIGVVDDGDGVYGLVYDSIGTGQQLERLAGVDLELLRDEVAAEVATQHMERRGYRVTREQEQGAIVLVGR